MKTLLTDDMRTALLEHDIDKVRELAERRDEKKKRYPRICKICGRRFFTNWENQVTCSVECARENRRQANRKRAKKPVQRMCVVCGKTFDTYRANGRKYCSEECAKKGRLMRLSRMKKVCPVCGKEFYACRETQVCCSTICAWKHKKGQVETNRGPRECERCSMLAEPGSRFCKKHIALELRKKMKKEAGGSA